MTHAPISCSASPAIGKARAGTMLRLALSGIAAAVLFALSMPAPAQAAKVAQIFASHAVGAGVVVDHSAWDKLLKAYIVKGSDGLNQVKYAKFKAADSATLQAYIRSLEKLDPAKLGKDEQFAYWANLYNAKTIDIVLAKYPVKSIKKIRLSSFFSAPLGGPWKAKVLKVKGTKLSLDDIEHGILRPIFKDPRVHYAVNCASIGCPNLAAEALTGAKLDAQLNKGAAAYINSSRGFKVSGGRVTGSSIYKWFKDDFGGSDAGVIAHASKYASPALKAKLAAAGSINGYSYDWSLNDAK